MRIYIPRNGALFCDPAGTGVAAVMKAAVLTNGLDAFALAKQIAVTANKWSGS
jgi:hypothetical protein